MKAKLNLLKTLAITLIALPLLATFVLNSAAAQGSEQAFDAAATFKAKCAMCHGQKAEKSFDASKADEQLVETVLKGVKPKMPAYETKGINAEQAKALVDHMKSLKQ